MRLLALTALVTASVALAADAPVTFHKDVEPILQRNCQTCHRPRARSRPMSFLTYQSVRPWAKAMKAAVVARKMPPWFADPQHGPYLNDRSHSSKTTSIPLRSGPTPARPRATRRTHQSAVASAGGLGYQA